MFTSPHDSIDTIPTQNLHEKHRNRSSKIILLVGGISAIGISTWLIGTWYQSHYARGSVLEHMPNDCVEFEYVNLAAIHQNTAFTALRTQRELSLQKWAEFQDQNEPSSTTIDAQTPGRAKALQALKEAGFQLYRDIQEIAICKGRGKDHTESLVVIGGLFRNRDTLTALRNAYLHRYKQATSESLQWTEIHKRPALKINASHSIVRATSQIVMIGSNERLTQHIKTHSSNHTYRIPNHEILVRIRSQNTNESWLPNEERYSFMKGQLVVHSVWLKSEINTTDTFLQQRMQEISTQLRSNHEFQSLADSYEHSPIKVERQSIQATFSWPVRNLTQVANAWFAMEPHKLQSSVSLLRTVPAHGFLQHATTTGFHYFGLELSAWRERQETKDN